MINKKKIVLSEIAILLLFLMCNNQSSPNGDVKVIKKETRNTFSDSSIFKLLDKNSNEFIKPKEIKNVVYTVSELCKLNKSSNIRNYMGQQYDGNLELITSHSNINIYYYNRNLRLVLNKEDTSAYLFFCNSPNDSKRNIVSISKLSDSFNIKYRIQLNDINYKVGLINRIVFDDNKVRKEKIIKEVPMESINSIREIDKILSDDTLYKFESYIEVEDFRNSYLFWLNGLP